MPSKNKDDQSLDKTRKAESIPVQTKGQVSLKKSAEQKCRA